MPAGCIHLFCGCSDQEWGCHNKAFSFGKPPQPGECHSPVQQKKHNRMLLTKTGTECPSRCVLFPGASSEGHSSPGTHIIFQICADLAAPAAFSTGTAGPPLRNWLHSSWVLNC